VPPAAVERDDDGACRQELGEADRGAGHVEEHELRGTVADGDGGVREPEGYDRVDRGAAPRGHCARMVI